LTPFLPSISSGCLIFKRPFILKVIKHTHGNEDLAKEEVAAKVQGMIFDFLTRL